MYSQLLIIIGLLFYLLHSTGQKVGSASYFAQLAIDFARQKEDNDVALAPLQQGMINDGNFESKINCKLTFLLAVHKI
jgi:hypothetical protein